MMLEARRSLVKDILWTIAALGAAAIILRFAWGLGRTTGLSDSTPWGLWIAFKLCFVAMAGGGFTLAAMVVVFHLERYRPILRQAVLLALLGYSSFVISLIFDLGLPWHIYMPIIHWQEHSVMFEVAWCVMLYLSVLLLEFGPVALEHRWFRGAGFQRLRALLKRLTVLLVIAGAVLSTLHQSSLGALFLVMPHRVHPLWYSPWLPVLFFLSAIAAGALVLVLENQVAFALFGRGRNPKLSRRLGKLAAVALWLYLAVRLGDLLGRGVLPAALDGSWQSRLFLAETLVGGVLPAALLSMERLRRRTDMRLGAALLGLLGVLSQRMAMSLFTMQRPFGQLYQPALLEVLIAVGIPAAALLVYIYFMENLPIMAAEPAPAAEAAIGRPVLGLRGPAVTLQRRTGLAVLALAALFAVLPGGAQPTAAASGLRVVAARGWEVLCINGDRQGGAVSFPHLAHQQRLLEQGLGEEEACRTCHHAAPPGDVATACSDCHRNFTAPSRIFDHPGHQVALGGNDSCVQCHLQDHSPTALKACRECHTDWRQQNPAAELSPLWAPSYLAAMHGQCVTCHQQQAQQSDQPQLAECSTCHAPPAEATLAGQIGSQHPGEEGH